MPKMTLTIEHAGPLLSCGADMNAPAFRVSSLRGCIRMWLRIHFGVFLREPTKLWQEESAIMGSTSTSSPITLLFLEKGDSKQWYNPVAPHATNQGGRPIPSIQALYDADKSFDLQLITRPGKKIDPRFMSALGTWLLIGGMGKRMRRLFGGIQLYSYDLYEDADLSSWCNFGTPKELAEVIKHHMETAQTTFASYYHAIAPADTLPAFPTLHPAHSRIAVSKTTYTTFEEAQTSFHDLLVRLKLDGDSMLGSVNPQRRSSPLIVQVRRLTNESRQFALVLTAMRTELVGPDWSKIDKVIDEINGFHVWGAPLSAPSHS